MHGYLSDYDACVNGTEEPCEGKVKVVLINVVKEKIEEIYDTYQLSTEARTMLEEQVSTLMMPSSAS